MSKSLPPLNWLRVFEAAARHESFARAADELNMSAAAVSQQVRALEDRLGAALFVRHAQKVILTERARAYLPGVQNALTSLLNTTEGLFGAAPHQQLYVQSVLIFAHGVLAPGYPDFIASHPGIVLTLSTGDMPGDFAPGFSYMQVIFGNPVAYGGDSDLLMGEVLRPVATPQIAAQIKSPADLLAFTLIDVSTHRAGCPYVLDVMAVPPGGTQTIMMDSTMMAMSLARQGVGIALARAPASDMSQADMGLVPCLPEMDVPGRESYHLVYPDRAALRPPGRAFRTWLLARCAAMRHGAD